jgi:hypothetical protein
MITIIEKNPQWEMLKIPLKHFFKENQELVLLSGKINREELERDLSVYYCRDNGKPSCFQRCNNLKIIIDHPV